MPESRGWGGIAFAATEPANAQAEACEVMAYLRQLGIAEGIRLEAAPPGVPETWILSLDVAVARRLAPGFDTLALRELLGLRPDDPEDLAREILVAMLAGPRVYRHRSAQELESAVRMRLGIVQAAGQTTLEFHTERASRPSEHWEYQGEARGFTLRPGGCLVSAIEAALAPGNSGGFSCGRASEYLALLGIAKEARRWCPARYEALCRQWERRALTADAFRAALLEEHGSLAHPLPLHYYVPGDRVWFRNPDDHSSDATGFEGSWVFYLGGGRFANFWERNRPFTLQAKCLEIYHWRDATFTDHRGELAIDEAEVRRRVQASAQSPDQMQVILKTMLRLRDPPGVYAQGGCIDASREHPRPVIAGSGGVELPDL